MLKTTCVTPSVASRVLKKSSMEDSWCVQGLHLRGIKQNIPCLNRQTKSHILTNMFVFSRVNTLIILARSVPNVNNEIPVILCNITPHSRSSCLGNSVVAAAETTRVHKRLCNHPTCLRAAWLCTRYCCSLDAIKQPPLHWQLQTFSNFTWGNNYTLRRNTDTFIWKWTLVPAPRVSILIYTTVSDTVFILDTVCVCVCDRD